MASISTFAVSVNKAHISISHEVSARLSIGGRVIVVNMVSEQFQLSSVITDAVRALTPC